MDKLDYGNKFHRMIEEDINNGVKTPTNDATLEDLKLLHSFPYRNFKNYENYEKMCPVSNRPARLYGTAKTHKFEHPRGCVA